MESLARRIRSLRETRGLSQEELGKRAGVSQRVVSTWEVGRTQVKVNDLPSLARALEVSYADLLGEESVRVRDTSISDRVRDKLMTQWEQLTPRDLAIVEEMAEAAARLRQRLNEEEFASSGENQ